ncbi:N-acetylmuramoyl-L-alanine amidase [Actinopolymorpha pittospori]
MRRSQVRTVLLRGGLVVGVAAALALGAVSGAGAQAAPPPSRADPVVSAAAHQPIARQQVYERAAREYGVPVRVLLAVSYLQTRWDTHRGEPSRAGGYGPMHLTDLATANAAEAGERRGDPARPRAGTVPHGPAFQTVDLAARLTGLDKAALRSDPTVNIRGGAAVLAEYQRRLGGPGATRVADWYGAVARYSGAVDQAGARSFADEVYALIRTGASRTTDDGQTITLAASPVTGNRAWIDRLGLPKPADGTAECPASLGCEWIPAPYEEIGGGDYGNHDLADRPNDQQVKYIVIHSTEGSYAGTVNLVQDPTYVSWHYTLRDSDGHIAQHVPTKDVAWHAGNWYVNAKSIGLEHEGYAARGTWYTEVMYRNSATLVRYLADRYDIPLDRQHILGHDNVPGVTPELVSGMHWDPGPYWDWAHYFELLGAPFTATGTATSGMVTIRPTFATNRPVFHGCEDNPGPPAEGRPRRCQAWPSSAIVLHTEPREDAPLLRDVGSNPPTGTSTTHVADIGSRVATGQQYAVAEVRGDWTALWYLGQKGWFYNPRSSPRALWSTGMVAKPKPGKASVQVYGRAYPEPAAYPPGVPVQALAPLQYTWPAGQAYVVGMPAAAEYYRAVTFDPAEHQVVKGALRYYQVQFGHRVAYVLADDVDVVASGG